MSVTRCVAGIGNVLHNAGLGLVGVGTALFLLSALVLLAFEAGSEVATVVGLVVDGAGLDEAPLFILL